MKYHPLYKLDRGALTGLEIGTVKASGPERPTVWLCGGHPSILADAETINASPWPRMTLNNTAEIISANWALFLDEPGGYLQNLLTDGQHVVIARLNYESAIVGGKKWCEQPRTMFLSDIGKEEGDWLSEGPLVWFKNSFCLAIQLLYRMGFRRILLAGCKFGDAGKYAYGERPDLADKNAKLYADQVEWLRRNLDYFAASGLEIWNTTPGNATPFLFHCGAGEAKNVELRLARALKLGFSQRVFIGSDGFVYIVPGDTQPGQMPMVFKENRVGMLLMHHDGTLSVQPVKP